MDEMTQLYAKISFNPLIMYTNPTYEYTSWIAFHWGIRGARVIYVLFHDLYEQYSKKWHVPQLDMPLFMFVCLFVFGAILLVIFLNYQDAISGYDFHFNHQYTLDTNEIVPFNHRWTFRHICVFYHFLRANSLSVSSNHFKIWIFKRDVQ